MRTQHEKKHGHHPQPAAPRRTDPAVCEPDCSPIEMRRNRYFTGRYLTAHDFRLEQGYFLSRHRLHNRLMHGWGIVCGLGVHPHPNPECANHVIVDPGIAIDCCGREIILEEPQVVVVWDADAPPPPPPPQEKDEGEYDEAEEDVAAQKPVPPKQPPDLTREESGYLLVISYCEEKAEFAPTLYDDAACGSDACDAGRLEANRILERACLSVVPWEPANRKTYADCWPTNEPEPRLCRDCDTKPDEPHTGCLEPACPCELGVPLALARPWFRDGKFVIVEESLDYSGRREMQSPPEYLTHIVGLNWPHGGQVSLEHLRDAAGMNGELRVSFDRKLLPSAPDNIATGVNTSTFIVEVHRRADVLYELALLHNDGNPPYLDEDGCTAVFRIDDELLAGRQNLGNHLLHVVLRCNFILDCHRRPVDGDHMKGVLPSGDGRAGGTFESWLWITDDYESRGGRRSR